MTTDQMRAIAEFSRAMGDGDIRLTVWQNLLISGVPDAKIEGLKAAIEAVGLDWRASSIRAGLVACTGNFGCKFRQCRHQTPRHGDCRAYRGGARDGPACQHSPDRLPELLRPALHRRHRPDRGQGAGGRGGHGRGLQRPCGRRLRHEATIARLIYPDTRAEEAPARVRGLLDAYLRHRATPDESFHAFANRHEVDALRGMAAEAQA